MNVFRLLSRAGKVMLENIRNSFHRVLRSSGFDFVLYRPANDPDQRLVHLIEGYGVKMLLDVGANVGQFAKRMIAAGYRDRIASFEPVSGNHSMLLTNAPDYQQWQVAKRCALGGQRRTVRVNIAGNSESSSILPMLERHVSALPISKYLGDEETELLRLDEFSRNTSRPASVPRWHLRWTYKGMRERFWTVRRERLNT